MKKITYILFTCLLWCTTISFSQENENNIFIGTWEIVEFYEPSIEITTKDCKDYYYYERRDMSKDNLVVFGPDFGLCADGGKKAYYYYYKSIESLYIKADKTYSEYKYPRHHVNTESYFILNDTLVLKNFESPILSNSQCSGLINQNCHEDYKGVLNATQDTLTIFATDYQPKAKLFKKQLDTTTLNNLEATTLNPKYLLGRLQFRSFGFTGESTKEDIALFLEIIYGDNRTLVDSLGNGFPYEIPYEIFVTEDNIAEFNGSENKIAFEIGDKKWVFEYTYYLDREKLLNCFQSNEYYLIHLKLLDWKDKYGNDLELIYSFDK